MYGHRIKTTLSPLVLSLALAAGLSAFAKGPEKYLYWGDGIRSDADVENFHSVLGRAARAGYTKVVLDAGLEYYRTWSSERKQLFARAKVALETNDLAVVADVWSLGYGAMLNYGLDLIEGAPIENSTYVVDGTNAVLRPETPSTPYFPNGGFESYSGKVFPNWTYYDGSGEQWCFRDTDVKHSGEASLRMEYVSGKGSYMRVSQRVTPATNRLYRFSAWVKTEDLVTSGGSGMTLSVQREGVTGKATFTTYSSKIEGTTDWTQIAIDFNSCDYGRLRLWIQAPRATAGRYWVDDVTLEEVPPPCVIHSDGTPITVKNAATGDVYEEGTDFDLFPRNPVYQQWTSRADRLKLTIPAGSRIAGGTELSVTWYSPATSGTGTDGQISICPLHTRLPAVLADSATNFYNVVRPTEWFLGINEWRNGNHCALCRAEETTHPQKIAALAARNRCRRRSSGTRSAASSSGRTARRSTRTDGRGTTPASRSTRRRTAS